MVGLAANDLLNPNSSQSFNIQSVHFAPALGSLAAAIRPDLGYDLDNISDNNISEGTDGSFGTSETVPSDSDESGQEPRVAGGFAATEVFRGPSGLDKRTMGV